MQEVSLFRSEKKNKKIEKRNKNKRMELTITYLGTHVSQIPIPEITVQSYLIQGKGAAVTSSPQKLNGQNSSR